MEPASTPTLLLSVGSFTETLASVIFKFSIKALSSFENKPKLKPFEAVVSKLKVRLLKAPSILPVKAF